jgi:hypothetical protein
MFRNLLKVGALLIVLTLGMAATASAHEPHGGHNHGGHNHGGGISIGWGGYPTFHNTSHYHYHPATLQQHGNHFHVIPGHYDLHQTGHWHW